MICAPIHLDAARRPGRAGAGRYHLRRRANAGCTCCQQRPRQDPARRSCQPGQRGAGSSARWAKKEQAESKLREAAAIPDLSMFEQAVIERGRGSVWLTAAIGRRPSARSRWWDGQQPVRRGTDQLQMVELLAELVAQEKDYLRAVSWLRRYLQDPRRRQERCAICCRRRCTWPTSTKRRPRSWRRASRPARPPGRHTQPNRRCAC